MAGLTPLLCAGWPAPPAFHACVDYHCDFVKSIQLSIDQWAAVRKIFKPNVTAATERRQIQQAIALLERLVGQQSGTWQDKPRNDGDSSEPGQLDCIAESINTTTYLELLAEEDLLVWHRVKQRKRRNPWFINIHWTAVIEDRTDEQHYAVDSWFFENGAPPMIQPLEDWLDKKPFDEASTNQDMP